MTNSNIPINLIYEDEPQKFMMEKILLSSKNNFDIGHIYPGRGYGYIKTRINNFNNAAKLMPYFILTDLDQDICAPSKINKWLKTKKHNNLIFRIAVHEIEAWALADNKNFSKYFMVDKNTISDNIDDIINIKEYMLNIIKKSRSISIKKDMLPIVKTAKIGPYYNHRLCKFIANSWNIELARKNSISLDRAVKSIDNFIPIWE